MLVRATRSGSATPSARKFWRSCATWGLTLRAHRRTNRSAHMCASYNGSRKWSGAKCGRRRAKLISKGRLAPRGHGVPVSHLPASAACRHRPSIKVDKFFARIAPPPFFIRPTTSDIIRLRIESGAEGLPEGPWTKGWCPPNLVRVTSPPRANPHQQHEEIGCRPSEQEQGSQGGY